MAAAVAATQQENGHADLLVAIMRQVQALGEQQATLLSNQALILDALNRVGCGGGGTSTGTSVGTNTGTSTGTSSSPDAPVVPLTSTEINELMEVLFPIHPSAGASDVLGLLLTVSRGLAETVC